MRIIVIFILMFVSSGAFAGNPIKRADSLLQKVYNKVDYDSPFYQFYVQKKSAGSWLAGLSYQGGSITTTDKVPGSLPELRLKANHVGIGGGYAYNLVAGKRWLLHLSVVPNLMVWTNNSIERDGEKIYTKTKFPTVLMNGRAGAVYFFSQRHFIGLFGVTSSLFKRKSETELMESEWMLRMFYGMNIIRNIYEETYVA